MSQGPGDLSLACNFPLSQLIIIPKRGRTKKVTKCVNEGLNLTFSFAGNNNNTSCSAGVWDEILNWLQYGIFIHFFFKTYIHYHHQGVPNHI